MERELFPQEAKVWLTFIVIVFVLLVFWFWSFFTVSQGYVAVTKTFGKMNDKVYTPWLHLKRPLVMNVEKFNIQTQKDQVVATSASKDLQNVNTEIAVNYSIDWNKVKEIYYNK